MDIGAELVRLASEGLSVIEVLSTWLPKDCELSYVSTALETELKTPLWYHYNPQDDALEFHVAAALPESRGPVVAAQGCVEAKVEQTGPSAFATSPIRNLCRTLSLDLLDDEASHAESRDTPAISSAASSEWVAGGLTVDLAKPPVCSLAD